MVGVAVFALLSPAPPAPVVTHEEAPPPAPELVQWERRRRGLLAGMIVGAGLTGAGLALLAGGLVQRGHSRICHGAESCFQPEPWEMGLVRGGVAVGIVGAVVFIPTAIGYAVGQERARKFARSQVTFRPGGLALQF